REGEGGRPDREGALPEIPERRRFGLPDRSAARGGRRHDHRRTARADDQDDEPRDGRDGGDGRAAAADGRPIARSDEAVRKYQRPSTSAGDASTGSPSWFTCDSSNARLALITNVSPSS